MDRFREKMRIAHYALATEKSYRYWILKFLRFHRRDGQWRHPGEMGKAEIEAFLTDLAVEQDVAASTQNQAFSAILFLFRNVLKKDFGWLDEVVRAKKPKHVPVVFTHDEAKAILGRLQVNYHEEHEGHEGWNLTNCRIA